jgi:hypothetical protein
VEHGAGFGAALGAARMNMNTFLLSGGGHRASVFPRWPGGSSAISIWCHLPRVRLGVKRPLKALLCFRLLVFHSPLGFFRELAGMCVIEAKALWRHGIDR